MIFNRQVHQFLFKSSSICSRFFIPVIKSVIRIFSLSVAVGMRASRSLIVSEAIALICSDVNLLNSISGFLGMV